VARKDRERARKRRAIERSRRESGWEPEARDDEDEDQQRDRRDNGKRPPSRSAGGGPAGRRPNPQAPLRKLKPGDVDRRGRVFHRAMVLHPRNAMFISLAVIAAAVVGLFRPRLQWLSYFAFAIGFLVFADSRPTWLQAGLWIAVAGVCAAAAVVLLIAVI
jgi:hypothetical protein